MADGGSSLFHRRLKAEFDDVLRCSMQTRLTTLREEVPFVSHGLHARSCGGWHLLVGRNRPPSSPEPVFVKWVLWVP